MNRTLTGFAILLPLLTASPVWAEGVNGDENALSRDRSFYLVGGLALGEYLDVADDFEAIFASRGLLVTAEATRSAGVDLRAGYRIHRNVAAEVQFQWNSEVNIKFQDIKALKLESWAVTANLKGYILTERMGALLGIQPYLVVGLGLMHFDLRDKAGLGFSDDGEDLAARFGGGLDLYVTPRIGLYFEVAYQLATGDIEVFDRFGISIGAFFNF